MYDSIPFRTKKVVVGWLNNPVLFIHPTTTFFVLHWLVQPSYLLLPRPTPSYLSLPHPTSFIETVPGWAFNLLVPVVSLGRKL